MLLVPKERATDEHIRRGWESGVDCYLTTPYDSAELKRFVMLIDNGGKAAAYRALAIEHAWRQETPQVLRYLEMGVEGVIPKPFDPLALPDAIESLWATREEKKKQPVEKPEENKEQPKDGEEKK